MRARAYAQARSAAIENTKKLCYYNGWNSMIDRERKRERERERGRERERERE